MRGRLIEQCWKTGTAVYVFDKTSESESLTGVCLSCCHRAFTAERFIKSLIEHFTRQVQLYMCVYTNKRQNAQI